MHEKSNNTTQNMIITRDGEVTTEFEPTSLDMARSAVLDGLSRVVGQIKLEARMVAYDALHGTNYRQIRHELVAQKKREAFERSIGLVAVGRK